MANIQTEKIVNLPKPVLDQAAKQYQMPNHDQASKQDIADWLVQNKPDTAQTLVETGKLPGF